VGGEASVAGVFIAGGERGSWQQAHTSASTADVEAVRWQQWRAVRHACVPYSVAADRWGRSQFKPTQAL
jgi:hypothetical protein